MRKIAFVVQRYGTQVNGGAEYYVRMMAERLAGIYDVTVITTTAVDYMTWEKYYRKKRETVNGVKVIRFDAERGRDMRLFTEMTQILSEKSRRHQKITKKEWQQWVCSQGPVCPKMAEYIKEKKYEYDVFLFVTYLFYTSTVCLPLIKGRAVFIPTAHDEVYIHLSPFRRLFHMPGHFIFLSEKEGEFVRKTFQNQQIPGTVSGVGVQLPPYRELPIYQDMDYLVYVGRICTGKSCDELLRFWEAYKKHNQNNLKLVLIGKCEMDLPDTQDLIYRGFVSEEEKFAAIADSMAMLLPSMLESLCISALEAFALHVPVIANGHCEVLKEHCRKSNAGLYYENEQEFEAVVNYLLQHPKQAAVMQENAKAYMEQNYQWDVILDRFCGVIETVAGQHS